METMSSQALREAAETSKAWPFEEARKLIARLERSERKEVIFETGYGPSGLPHLGTFGEVARTSMVRHAFRVLAGDSVTTKLIAFSDDMDGLRKVPDNIPNRDLILPHLGKPLTQVPDPFGEYAASPNTTMRGCVLFWTSSDSNTNSFLQPKLPNRDGSTRRCCECWMVSTRCKPSCCPRCARSERQPIRPSLQFTRVRGSMQVRCWSVDLSAGAIHWRDPDGLKSGFETPVTGGRCKLQWKPDWAMRWYELGVRLRNGRKGSNQFGQAIVSYRAGFGGGPARWVQLRALSRREQPEDFENEGQRPDN